MKPLLSYYGGKQRMVNKILPLIPKHINYVEPFAGGLSVLCAKPFPTVSSAIYYREIINDIDKNLINFYRCLQDPDKLKSLVQKIELSLFSKEDFILSKDMSVEDDVERARRYFVRVSQAFSGMWTGGWKFNVKGSNEAYVWLRRVERLPEFVERIRQVIIECDDAIRIIKKYDSPHTFFYVDPPYVGTRMDYDCYTVEEYQKLCGVLDGIKGSFLLSSYDNGLTPKHWEKFTFDTLNRSATYWKTSGKNVDIDDRRVEAVFRKFSDPSEEYRKIYSTPAFDCFQKHPWEVQ